MKTQGISLSESGSIILPWRCSVPLPFWSRLKHHIAKAGLLDEFNADFQAAREHVRARIDDFDGQLVARETEDRLWDRWVTRVCGPQRLRISDRGWTPDLVDSYPEVTLRKAVNG